MRSKQSARRGFLKGAGAGLAGVTGFVIGAGIPNTAAKGIAGMGRPDETHGDGRIAFDVRAFGAVGDGKTVDTVAINRAIEAAAAAGGGTVYFRAGSYLCYSIHLKSKVALYLDQGATIVAADPAADASK